MKKQWISVKCGLSRDPKHRRRMGKSVWTFLHMLDLADWETGILYGWKDADAAEDMGVDLRVIRDDRQKLQEEDYISCSQKQHGQDITIKNWTNPREYSGQVYNKKGIPSDAEGTPQGTPQGMQKEGTPTYSSKIKDQKDFSFTPLEQEQNDKKINALLDMANFPGAKREARVNSILSYLSETFRKNVETKEWREFAKYIDGQHQAEGWDVKDFVKWLYSQKNFDLQYWSVRKMFENYPAAFTQAQETVTSLEDLGWK